MKNETPQQEPVASREGDKFTVRFPEGMRDRIAALARQSGRSMNTEIVARLNETIEPADVARPDISAGIQKELAAIRDLVEKLHRRLDEKDKP